MWSLYWNRGRSPGWLRARRQKNGAQVSNSDSHGKRHGKCHSPDLWEGRQHIWDIVRKAPQEAWDLDKRVMCNVRLMFHMSSNFLLQFLIFPLISGRKCLSAFLRSSFPWDNHFHHTLGPVLFWFFFLITFIFILDCAGSSLLHGLSLIVASWASTKATPYLWCVGFSLQWLLLQKLWCTGSVTPWHVGSSQTSRWIPYHWASREALGEIIPVDKLMNKSDQSLSHVRLFATPWITACQASLSITNSWSSLTHIHQVSDAIQPSHPLSSPSPPAPNPSQHQSLFQWVNSSHEVAKVLEFQL